MAPGRFAGAILALMPIAACDAPTAPSDVASVPNVAGRYSGDITMTTTGWPEGTEPTDCYRTADRCTITGTFTVTAEQVDSEVVLTGRLTWQGGSTELVWDAVPGHIDAAGRWRRTDGGGDYDDPACGRVRYDQNRSRGIHFASQMFQVHSVANTDHCGQFELEAHCRKM